MSDLLPKSQLSDSLDCPPAANIPICEKLLMREARIGRDLIIRRALPHRDRRMIGAWCFLDHFGPLDLSQGEGLKIGPHPHIGLQTVTWLVSGEIEHRDSLSTLQLIKPGQVNLMTAGKGIAHSEQSVAKNGHVLHGVQLWIALPDAVRHAAPNFSHYAKMPTLTKDNLFITVLAGEFAGSSSPTTIYSPLVGLDIHTMQDGEAMIPLEQAFEYGIVVLEGVIQIEDDEIKPGELLYLGQGRHYLPLHAKKDTRIFIVGGEPFKEEILIWWNFVGRTKEEIEEATNDWNEGRRFGKVEGFPGPSLIAPPVPWST